jgi:urease gamma subunit
MSEWELRVSPRELHRLYVIRLTIAEERVGKGVKFAYPQANQTDPHLIIDASIVKRIEQSGFIAAL